MPTFSIIIPTYNRAEHLKQCLESVKRQNFEDWECIVVDDGSMDNTHELVESFLNEDARFRYHYQENAERCAARNNGIAIAKGEYICFLDSDDAFTPEHLVGFYHYLKLQNFPKVFLYCNFLVNGKEQGKLEALPLDKKELTKHLLNYSIIPDRVCIPISAFEFCHFDEDITVGEDGMLWARIAQFLPLIAIEQSTVLYALHDENTIHLKNNSAEKLLLGFKKYFVRYPKIRAQLSNEDIRMLYSNIYFSIAKHYLYKWKKGDALKALLASVLLNWKHEQRNYKINLMIKVLLGNRVFVQKELEQ